MSESLYAPLIAGVILAGYALWDRPGPLTAAVLGGLIGLAALTRGDLGEYQRQIEIARQKLQDAQNAAR